MNISELRPRFIEEHPVTAEKRSFTPNPDLLAAATRAEREAHQSLLARLEVRKINFWQRK